MNVSLKTFVPTIALSAMTLTSCNNDSDILSIAKQYCLENNKTVKDYKEIENTIGRDEKTSKLDSMVYFDIFRATQLVNDSSKIAEFNKIVAQNRSEQYDESDVRLSLNEKATNYGMLLKDYEKMHEKRDIAYRQNFLDNFVFQKFFKDNNVLDKNVKAKCDAYSKKISSSLE